MKIKTYELRLNEEMFEYDLPEINSPETCWKFAKEVKMHVSPKEKAAVLLLNSKLKAIGFEEVSIGSDVSTFVTPRGVFTTALKTGASGVVLIHNHPSGDPTPSREDRELFTRLKEAGEILDIKMLDSIIVTSGSYTSLMESEVN